MAIDRDVRSVRYLGSNGPIATDLSIGKCASLTIFILFIYFIYNNICKPHNSNHLKQRRQVAAGENNLRRPQFGAIVSFSRRLKQDFSCKSSPYPSTDISKLVISSKEQRGSKLSC